MKKFLMYGLLLAGVVLTSCQYTEMIDPVTPDKPQQGKTRLQVTIEEPAGSMMPSTRGPLAPTGFESDVYNLHLLFFEHTTDGSGKLVADYDVASTYLTTTAEDPSIYILGEPFELEIGTGEGVKLSHTERYTILAYANIDVVDMEAMAEGTTTENEVREIIHDFTDDEWNDVIHNSKSSYSILPDKSLPMSGTTIKEPDQELVTLKLTRMVARIDVELQLEGYELQSMYVFQMAQKSRIWESLNPDDLGIADQTYTYTLDSPTVGYNALTSKTVYVFENFVGDPITNKDKLTTLVLRLKNEGNSSVRFYRVDLHPEGEGQSLKRNHVYQVTVKGVVSEGADNELSALQSTDQMLDYTINNWAADEDGLILNDGTNLLVAPSRYIRFGPEAGTREYLIYTYGTGTPEITKRNLPDGFTVTLSGNTLKVEVTALPGPVNGYQEERTGNIELGYAGMRGTIQIVQSPRDDYYLNLDKKSPLPIWPSGGGSANTITVSSSGSWKAEIYNTVDNAEPNPGFSFEGGVFTASGDNGDPIRVVPTGSNPSNSVRQGFVIVTLDDDKKYRQVLVMQQEAIGTIEITPDYDPVVGLPFDAGGFAKLVGNGSTQNYYQINVQPGKDANGKLNVWDALLSGTDAEFFTLTKVNDPIAPYVVISAKGENNPGNPGFNFGGAKEAMVTVMLPGGNTVDGSAIELSLTQEALVFDFTRISSAGVVPVTGSMVRTKVWADDVKRDDYTIREEGYRDFVEYRINLPASLQWRATIVGQSLPNTSTLGYQRHEGYLIDNDGNKVAGATITGRTPANTVRVGFDQIYYPLIQYADDEEVTNRPEVRIKVEVLDKNGVVIGSIGSQEITVRQEPLKPKTLEMLSMGPDDGTTGYGAISSTGGGSHYITRFRTQLINTTNFGPTGTVRMNRAVNQSITKGLTDTWTDPVAVPIRTTRNYIHAAAHHPEETWYWADGAYTAAENWRRNPETQGMMFWTGMDDANNTTWSNNMRPFTSPSTLAKLGWRPVQTSGANTLTLTRYYPGQTQTRVMKYLAKGPLGSISPVPNADWSNVVVSIPGLDAANCTVVRSSLGPNAVVILTKEVSSTYPGAADEVLLALDPIARVAFLGDTVLFEEGYINDTNTEMPFIKNFLAILMNAAQYGDHFLELLNEDCLVPLYLPDGTLVAAP